MIDPVEAVVGVVAWNGGSLVGKTRLQKYAYLLEASGMNSGLDFEYYIYGPYSEELAIAADDAQFSGKLAAQERVGNHQVPYVEYVAPRGMQKPKNLGDLSDKDLTRIIPVLQQYSALDLEIASTIHYLRENGYGKDAVAETKRRKPLKATDTQVERALRLLKELSL